MDSREQEDRRALVLRELLEGLPRVDPPAELDQRVRAAALSRPAPLLRPLLRAAVVLLAIGAAVWILELRPGRGYQPLDLRVVVEDGNGAGEEQLILEELYGPGAPAFLAGGGEAGGSSGR